ncbi:AAA family ATPase [Consotaella salsifontis]|uniref:AAA domain-containing protein n=1 Tax=Consotaella salsifontis TaxID=1365950 RepID=A0A1T4RVF4_9HYPH|nr:AAA family ATPase [Consotaella salsifontis]SKA19994.1 AAA domain-containing protein [Consotaella salsifontis]
MFVIFDLDGTIANIGHRVHFVRGTRKPDWDAFFKACVDDLPVPHVIDSLRAHIAAGHRVEIWSARSAIVRDETKSWLASVGIDPSLLRHMRAIWDNTPDVELKRFWLNQEYCRPDLVYDDRQRIVDMWRAEGVPCFQVVADWDGDRRIIAPVCNPLLTVMVGPSGAGKTSYARDMAGYLSSDLLRYDYTGSIADQSRNDDVFTALHRIAKARLDSGLPVTIDATNLRRRDRLACVALAPAGAGVRYIVIDRPLAEKARDGGWRNDVMVGDKTLIEAHHERMQSALRDILAGDGLPHVAVVDLRGIGMRAAA